MTEQTQTEKLREKIAEILYKQRWYEGQPTWEESLLKNLFRNYAGQILQDCKKSGLIWFNRGNLQRILYQCGLSTEQVIKVKEAVKSQIKELKE